MHECPDCGQACACDGDDVWTDDNDDCVHECGPDGDFFFVGEEVDDSDELER